MKWIAALIGAIVGYYVVAYPSCTWLWPNSNMCGIFGPIDAVIGAVLAFWLTSRKRRS
jgi:uncharacterized membrane protein YeaQ/YmgE (transglycosylase-associated protein family)